ncbi:MAG: SUMF1/EgtB/PvdO family nonheme iron enzyme [Deltaproteobacteria bacterium]|nr:SUMF1/EgtB/PvdO family nonheme iron enzyme [Deltaproteobacteria bacterium]
MAYTKTGRVFNFASCFSPLASCLLPLASCLLLLGSCAKPPSDMVQVPAGEFIMGSNEVDREAKAQQYGDRKPWYSNERPERKVRLEAFYIDKHETTNVQYAEFVKTTGHRPPDYWPGGIYASDTANIPVVMVNWHDADTYCKWKGKRLPTEAEWEKAARGADGRRFPWGNEFDIKKVNTLGGYGGPMAVGTFEHGKSPYGAYDMAGNAQEWIEDWYKAYPDNDFNDKDYGEKFKVVRGGGWGGMGHYSLQVYVRTAYRNIAPPDGRFNDVGFRCAKGK